MTEKQENILKAALRLFAQEGYAATSTSKVAKAANVSEGLIFKHFGSKEGLLVAIMAEAHESSKHKFADVLLSSEPKEIIRKLLELPFGIDSAEHEMWRLIYALKWQTVQYNASGFDSIKLILKDAFAKLGYRNPAAEAELVFMFIDGAATAILLHEPNNKTEVLQALKEKYQL